MKRRDTPLGGFVRFAVPWIPAAVDAAQAHSSAAASQVYRRENRIRQEPSEPSDFGLERSHNWFRYTAAYPASYPFP